MISPDENPPIVCEFMHCRTPPARRAELLQHARETRKATQRQLEEQEAVVHTLELDVAQLQTASALEKLQADALEVLLAMSVTLCGIEPSWCRDAAPAASVNDLAAAVLPTWRRTVNQVDTLDCMLTWREAVTSRASRSCLVAPVSPTGGPSNRADDETVDLVSSCREIVHRICTCHAQRIALEHQASQARSQLLLAQGRYDRKRCFELEAAEETSRCELVKHFYVARSDLLEELVTVAAVSAANDPTPLGSSPEEGTSLAQAQQTGLELAQMRARESVLDVEVGRLRIELLRYDTECGVMAQEQVLASYTLEIDELHRQLAIRPSEAEVPTHRAVLQSQVERLSQELADASRELDKLRQPTRMREANLLMEQQLATLGGVRLPALRVQAQRMDIEGHDANHALKMWQEHERPRHDGFIAKLKAERDRLLAAVLETRDAEDQVSREMKLRADFRDERRRRHVRTEAFGAANDLDAEPAAATEIGPSPADAPTARIDHGTMVDIVTVDRHGVRVVNAVELRPPPSAPFHGVVNGSSASTEEASSHHGVVFDQSDAATVPVAVALPTTSPGAPSVITDTTQNALATLPKHYNFMVVTFFESVWGIFRRNMATLAATSGGGGAPSGSSHRGTSSGLAAVDRALAGVASAWRPPLLSARPSTSSHNSRVIISL